MVNLVLIWLRQGLHHSLIAGLILASATVFAEVEKIELPLICSDFALHPETGTLVGLDAKEGEILFWRQENLRSGNLEPVKKVSIGSNPISVCYKEYQGLKIFAVACQQDANLYLIHAGGSGTDPSKEFTLLKRVSITDSNGSMVTSSQNPNDPFLYYVYWKDRNHITGVVSLRDFTDKGNVFNDSSEMAISSKGDIAYRRTVHSTPNGFDSFTRINRLDAEKPNFVSFFEDHESSYSYVPDPYNHVTASGRGIYDKSLRKQIANLDFYPLCFSQKKPLIFGLDFEYRVLIRGLTHRFAVPEKLVFKAASYNTFASVGEEVKFELSYRGEASSRFSSRRDASGVRLFSDDDREQLIFATQEHICFLPLADFNLPDEPLLFAELEGSSTYHVGEESQITLKPSDPRVEVKFDDLPEGMKQEGEHLLWKPSPDQLGDSPIVATFKHNDLERSVQYDLKVEYPSIRLPFPPSDFMVDAKGKKVLIWEGPKRNEHGYLQTTNLGTLTVETISNLAVIDLTTGEVLAERKLSGFIYNAFLSENYVVLQPLPGKSRECEILKLDDLERKTTLNADGPILHCDLHKDKLILQTQTTLEVYGLDDFARLKRFENKGSEKLDAVSEHGIFVDEVLYDFDFQPKLLAKHGLMPSARGRYIGYSLQRKDTPFEFAVETVSPQTRGYPVELNHIFTGSSRRTKESNELVTRSVPGRDMTVTLEVYPQVILESIGGSRNARAELELILRFAGASSKKQPLVRYQYTAQFGRGVLVGHCGLRVADDRAYVLFSDSLYSEDIPEIEGKPTNSDQPIALMPEQSVIVLPNASTTELKHKVIGGKSPYIFSLLQPQDGLELNPSTGTVTASTEELTVKASEALAGYLKGKNQGEPYSETSSRFEQVLKDQAKALLEKIPFEGFPVTIPISIAAKDTASKSAHIAYYVVVQVSPEQLKERLLELEEERKKMEARAEELAAQQRAKAAQMAQARSNTQQEASQTTAATAEELKDLRRQIEKLELQLYRNDPSKKLDAFNERFDKMDQRLNLITYQLFLLMKKLDEGKE
ncbi:Hypothetical protein PBC10988_19450 [Planctomycetales bacterium 10988]|nr:Hypothetical protein PBC10988_19450 [Planctomycetales bacterium 10988]